MKTLSPPVVPSVTLTAVPGASSPPVSASAARTSAEPLAVQTQIPFCAAAVWFLSSTRSPAASATPSSVAPGAPA